MSVRVEIKWWKPTCCIVPIIMYREGQLIRADVWVMRVIAKQRSTYFKYATIITDSEYGSE